MSDLKSTRTTNKLLLILVTIILPPVGVAMDKGIKNEFWISLLLTLIFFFPGLIYSLYIVLK